METTMRYSLSPVKMTIIEKTENNKCWQGCRGSGTLAQYSVGKNEYQYPHDTLSGSCGQEWTSHKDSQTIGKTVCSPQIFWKS